MTIVKAGRALRIYRNACLFWRPLMRGLGVRRIHMYVRPGTRLEGWIGAASPVGGKL